MRRVCRVVVLCVLGGCGIGVARGLQATAGATTEQAAWAKAIAARRQELVAQNGPGTDAALRAELLTMRDRDQAARGLPQGEAPKERLQMASNLKEIDAALTARLKEIVAAKGWPTIALVGIDASNAAMLVLNHSADHGWQRELLPQLEALADAGSIDGSSLAGVVDKELVSEGRAQRYGTQFKLVDGEMRMYAVEDPGGLDALRARTLLPPMAEYKQLLSRLYHLKTSDKVASAAAAAP